MGETSLCLLFYRHTPKNTSNGNVKDGLNEKRWKATVGAQGRNRTNAGNKLGETDINNENSISSSHAN